MLFTTRPRNVNGIPKILLMQRKPAEFSCGGMIMLLRRIVGRMNICLRVVFAAMVTLTTIGLLLSLNSIKPDLRYCFMDQMPTNNKSLDMGWMSSGLQRLPDVLLAELKPSPGRSIFFHETSCRQKKLGVDAVISTLNNQQEPVNQIKLTARQACAIESAALHNPNLSVFVLYASPSYHTNTTSDPLLGAILSYTNVHLRNLNLWTYAAGTPIYEWLKEGVLFESDFVLSHISDFLRYVTLWRWGGTYLDMDIIMLRSIEEVPPNYTGAESDTHLAAGVMNFAPDGFGHEIAEMCLQDFQHNFNGRDWGNNGPGVITRVIQEVCGTRNIALMLDYDRCMGFKVFARDAFYAIRWVNWKHFFKPAYEREVMERTKLSYVAHLWNKHSKKWRFKVGEDGAYGKLAAQHCPKSYAAAGEYF